MCKKLIYLILTVSLFGCIYDRASEKDTDHSEFAFQPTNFMLETANLYNKTVGDSSQFMRYSPDWKLFPWMRFRLALDSYIKKKELSQPYIVEAWATKDSLRGVNAEQFIITYINSSTMPISRIAFIEKFGEPSKEISSQEALFNMAYNLGKKEQRNRPQHIDDNAPEIMLSPMAELDSTKYTGITSNAKSIVYNAFRTLCIDGRLMDQYYITVIFDDSDNYVDIDVCTPSLRDYISVDG